MKPALLTETFKDGIWSSTFQHIESIQSLVKDLSQDDFLTLIRLSCSALTHLHTSASSLKYKEALAIEIDAHSKRMMESHTKEKEAYTSQHTIELIQLKATIEELQIQNKSLKTQYMDLHTVNEETFRSAISTLKREKDEQYTKEIERMREDMKERVNELQKIYSESSQKVKKETCVSSEIGKKGEKEFEELVAEYTDWGTLTNTSKTPHNADWACMIRKVNTLFEIKNYSSNVPMREITKFEDDMKLHSDVPFGVFISMNTEITGKRFHKSIVIVWTSEAQMLIYISCFREQDMKAIFMFLDICVDIAYRCYRLVKDRPDDSDTCIILQRKIQGIQTLVEKELISLATWVRDTKAEHRVAMDVLEKQHIITLGRISHTKTSLLNILELMGTDTSTNIIDVNGVVTEDYVTAPEPAPASASLASPAEKVQKKKNKLKVPP